MMKKIRLSIAVLLLFMLVLAGCGRDTAQNVPQSGYDVTDIQGHVTHFAEKPKHIVTLSLSTDITMLGLVEPERMAAINALADDPVSSNIAGIAQNIPEKIGMPTSEQLMALHPDLVVAPDWGDITIVDSLRDLGIPVVVCKGVRSIDEIRETVTLLAAAAGEPARGEDLVRQMDEKLAALKEETSKIPTAERKTVVLISLMSSYGGIGSTFDDACGYAGVKNGMAELGIHTGQVMTKEQLVAIDPDILFLPTYNAHGTYDVAAFREKYLGDPALATLKAIKTGALREPREGYIYNGSQDIVFGAQEIAYMAYGDAFAQPDGLHLTAVKR